MPRELTKKQVLQRSIIKTYRQDLWNGFVRACQDYELVSDGDRIAVFLDGGCNSLLTALCLEQLKRISDTSFELELFCQSDGIASKLSEYVSDVRVTGEHTDSLGCNKLALHTTMSDVIDNLLYGMLCKSRISSILPKEKQGSVEIIRPLFCIRQADIDRWNAHNSTGLVSNADSTEQDGFISSLVTELKKNNPDIEHNVFTSVHNVKLDTFI